MHYATEYGNLEVIKWLKENGCPWDTRTCTFAALNGHLEVLKWLKENGCPWDTRTYSNAAVKRSFRSSEMVKRKWMSLGYVDIF